MGPSPAEPPVSLLPIVRLADRSIVGHELHAPDAHRTLDRLRAAGNLLAARPGVVHVHVDVDDLATPLFAQSVVAAVGHANCRRLILEVGGRQAVVPGPHLERTLASLRDAGARIASADLGDEHATAASASVLRSEVLKARYHRLVGPEARPGLLGWLERREHDHRARVVITEVTTDDELRHVHAAGFEFAQGPRWPAVAAPASVLSA